MFIKDILNNLNKDWLKEIKNYLYKNRVYIWKEAKKLITDSLLRAIHKPTPLKWPADDPTDNPTDNPTNDPTDSPTNDPTLALLLPPTVPV